MTFSPRTRSACRLVTSSFRPGQSARSSTIVGAATVTCSKLSRTSRTCWARSCRRSSSSGDRSTVSASPMAVADQREDGIGVGRGDEVDEVDAVGESVDLVRGGPDCEPCLAGPAGSRQRDEADVVVVEALADRLQLGVAADERRRLGREVVRPEVERGERRELGREARVARPGRCAAAVPGP